MKPQIEFKHVLGELSVNRNDPCEILRELISNSYDANAKEIFYAPLNDLKSLIFLDNGHGLNPETKINGITPWEAFFSIGKSTKKKGESIGYKCQGTKLCFACSRIFVATKPNHNSPNWHFKIIDNPRTTLDTTFDITPKITANIDAELDSFYPTTSSDTDKAIKKLKEILNSVTTGTLIIIDSLDTENFGKYFSVGKKYEESYVFNYIRFYTRHGDVRHTTKDQGFSASQIKQVSSKISGVDFQIFANKKLVSIPFGYPYLDTIDSDASVKPPSQVSRLRDGRFFSRSAKSFSAGGASYSIILTIDGNRRAHEEYKNLDRKGKSRSGVRLSDHRGFFISVKGIKICKYPDLLASIAGYEVLAEGDSPSHYSIILDGDFDLVTNRNSLSKKAFDTLSDQNFTKEIKKFLDSQRDGDKIFSELLSRLRRESTENLLNDQIEILSASKDLLRKRERFRITDEHNTKHLFLSPQPGEEYLVGVLYALLPSLLPRDSSHAAYWKKIVTFSTQGIDSLALQDPSSVSPLAESNVLAIEYKYEFNNYGPFNHALAVVDYIIAWVVDIDTTKNIRDSFTCFGDVRKSEENEFEWEIHNIENDDGGQYPQTIKVICLKKLIEEVFKAKFSTPPP